MAPACTIKGLLVFVAPDNFFYVFGQKMLCKREGLLTLGLDGKKNFLLFLLDLV